jgi:hypothetical protein
VAAIRALRVRDVRPPRSVDPVAWDKVVAELGDLVVVTARTECREGAIVIVPVLVRSVVSRVRAMLGVEPWEQDADWWKRE